MKKLLLFAVPLLTFVACSSFSTNTWRTEQTAVDTAYAAYVGWTNYLNGKIVGGRLKDAEDQVREARLKFAASVVVVEAWRQAYETNSAVKPQLLSAVDALMADSSNIVWTINYLKQ